jgi:hypothetical protein
LVGGIKIILGGDGDYGEGGCGGSTIVQEIEDGEKRTCSKVPLLIYPSSIYHMMITKLLDESLSAFQIVLSATLSLGYAPLSVHHPLIISHASVYDEFDKANALVIQSG